MAEELEKQVDKIRKLKEHYIKELYPNVLKEQAEDQRYRDDTFAVPEIREPHKKWRSGIGARMIDAPAEQIVTSNPQAFVEVLKGSTESGVRIAKEFNKWIDILKRQNPNPFKESVKNKGARGENYIKICHNEMWVTGGMKRYGLPVLFLIPDPMVIFGSPQEDDNGIPYKVVVFYERQPQDLIIKYPNWKNPKQKGVDGSKNERLKVEWLEYYDSDIRYWEADGEPVLEGIVQPNIYGLTPFIHKLSGFGRRSPEGKLEDLIVSDIRLARDLIKRECITASNIASIEHIFAHRPLTIVSPTPGISADSLNELQFGSYDINQLTFDPQSGPPKFELTDYPSVPPEMYANWAALKREIYERCPFISPGFPSASSGRHEDMRWSAAMKRYETVVENTEYEWGTAFEKAFEILKKVPKLLPDGLNKSDLKTEIRCFVKLRAKDPIEEDRKITLGDRLWAQGQGSISLKRFHVEYQGMTDAESDEEVARILVDKLTIQNPDVAEVMGMVFAEEAGLKQQIDQAKQRRQQIEGGEGLQQQPPETTMQRIQGESQSAQPQVGARKPPVNYTRGQ